MKKLLLSAVLVAVTAVSYGQGTVNFSNASSAFSGDTSRLNRFSEGAPPAALVLAPGWGVTTLPVGVTANSLVTSNVVSGLRAQLYYGAAGATSFSQLTAVTAAPAFFRSTTSVNPGSWLGGNRTVNTWAQGTVATLGVIVWDINKAADGLAALNALAAGTYGGGAGGVFGMSSLFSYTVPGTLDPPSAYLMANLTAFNVINYAPIPEPSSFALAGLGAAALLIFRRRK